MTRLIALLGNPVEHSLSPAIQNAAIEAEGLDARYLSLQCSRPDVSGLLRGIARAGGAGNVTLPHKAEAARLVDRPAEAVRQTGACNTFWCEEGVIHGDNTDVVGAHEALRLLLGRKTAGIHALVLGAGGASRAVVLALALGRAERVRIRNRTGERIRELFEGLRQSVSQLHLEGDEGPLDRPVDPEIDLVINATSLGLRQGDLQPVSMRHLPEGIPLLDLVYRPEETAWVREARSHGHDAHDGGEMLVQQGAASFERWWNRPAPLDVMRGALERARQPRGTAP